MDYMREKTPEEIIDILFTNTLIPFFSWCLCQLSSVLLGCKLILVLRHPTKAYIERVSDSWVKHNQLFSCSEILDFEKASGRRRGRKKLKKIYAPFFHNLKRSPECSFFRHRFHEELNRLWETAGEIPPMIPHKVVKQFDIEEIEKRRNEEFDSFSEEDILDTFPVHQTAKPGLASRIMSEVGDYKETVRSLWWEASRDWRIMRQISVRKNSKILTLLGINPDDEPDMGQLINFSIDFALGKVDDDKLTHLARWVMGRMLVSQFLEYAYSKKQIVSLETDIANNITLKDTLADERAAEPFYRIEDREALDGILLELPAAQREACDLLLHADSEELRLKLGDKKYKAVVRNFERALKRLREQRESGRLDS